MVAAPRARVPAVEHELLRAKPRLARLFIEDPDVIAQLAPARCGVNVDFDDTRVGRHGEHSYARIARRRIAFEPQRHLEAGRGVLDGRDQGKVILDAGDRRYEDVELPVAHFDTQRRMDDLGPLRPFPWIAVVEVPA